MHLLAPSWWCLIIVETALWNGLFPVTGTVCYLPSKVSDNGAHHFCCFLSVLSLTNQTPLDLSFSLTQDQLWYQKIIQSRHWQQCHCTAGNVTLVAAVRLAFVLPDAIVKEKDELSKRQGANEMLHLQMLYIGKNEDDNKNGQWEVVISSGFIHCRAPFTKLC